MCRCGLVVRVRGDVWTVVFHPDPFSTWSPSRAGRPRPCGVTCTLDFLPDCRRLSWQLDRFISLGVDAHRLLAVR